MLAHESDKPGASYLMAQLLMEAGVLREAADVLSKALADKTFSEPHVDLLYCYVRTGQRSKARALIASFPPDWSSDRKARHLAIELGQSAGDWTLLQSLITAQLLIFAVSLDLRGVWLQAMLLSMRNAGRITPLAYAQRQFLVSFAAGASSPSMSSTWKSRSIRVKE